MVPGCGVDWLNKRSINGITRPIDARLKMTNKSMKNIAAARGLT
jgi:hypothetical protein